MVRPSVLHTGNSSSCLSSPVPNGPSLVSHAWVSGDPVETGALRSRSSKKDITWIQDLRSGSNSWISTQAIPEQRGLEPPTFRFMPNALTIWAIRARHLLSHVFEYWLWQYRYYISKVNIWNVNCARTTAFIFDTWTDVLVKVSKFMRQKMSWPEGDSNPQPSDLCWML